MKKQNENRLQFSVKFEGQPKGYIPLAAHVYDKSGNHLESAEVDKEGNFVLSSAGDDLQNSRVYIAPANKQGVPSLKDLEKINAYQPYINTRNLFKEKVELLPIPELNYKFWWWCTCRVTGRVTKQVFIGGALQVLPVCKARVHICEVDRWPIIIWQLPDDIIYRIRDEIVAIKWPVPPIPDPGPLKGVDIRFPAERINAFASRSAMQSNAQAQSINTASAASLAQNNFKAQLASGNSAYHLRLELADNFQLIYPYICYWQWLWPYFYSCDELAMIETDSDGRFDTDVYYYCFGDKPDVYVWVEYFIDGQWVTVYNPGRACHTHWDYSCGTPINITVTDSRVPHCGRADVRGEIAEILSIGNNAYTSHILQRSATQTVQGVSFDARGLTNVYLDVPGVRYLNPFGGGLNVIADFGTTLHTSGVTHFRCSYKKNSDADVPANWTILDNPLPRYYEDEIDDGINPPFQQRKSFDLKDASYSGLYVIPHHDAATQPGLPAPSGTLIFRGWLTEAFAIASIDSTNLQDDMYDFKFELYRITAGLPERVSVPKSTFQVPNPDDTTLSLPLSNTGFTSAAYPDFNTADYIIQDTGIAANAFGFKMTFRVDNNPTDASIDNVTVINNDGTTATSDTECGFAEYKHKNSSKVKFSFAATHPNNFATLSFTVVRGNNNPCPDANTGGMVIGSTAQGYTLAAGKFTKQVDVADLLGTCRHAAFAENLYVTALATDGTRRLHEYDSSWTAAFALEHANS